MMPDLLLERAAKAPAIRRIFSSSPKDPRYHMLTYISSKFTTPPSALSHEPRAALFVNRFTRTSTIIYATNGVADILGLEADQLLGKSFYSCIAETCLQDAVRCVESAKANDSIAYLRFWFRDPTRLERRASDDSSRSDEDQDDGGVNLRDSRSPRPSANDGASLQPSTHGVEQHPEDKSQSSGNSRESGNTQSAVFDRPANRPMSSTSSFSPENEATPIREPIEVEAVVSCTSDGLVIIVRSAQALPERGISPPAPLDRESGFFVSPWAPAPIVPESAINNVPEAFGPNTASVSSEPSGPTTTDFMKSIREVAVFAWSLTGINGSLHQFSKGMPQGEAEPPDGIPIWDPSASVSDERFNGFEDNSHRRISDQEMKEKSSTTSEDEILYRRSANMPSWRPVQRRGRQEAFGDEGDVDGDERHHNSSARRRRLDH